MKGRQATRSGLRAGSDITRSESRWWRNKSKAVHLTGGLRGPVRRPSIGSNADFCFDMHGQSFPGKRTALTADTVQYISPAGIRTRFLPITAMLVMPRHDAGDVLFRIARPRADGL